MKKSSTNRGRKFACTATFLGTFMLSGVHSIADEAPAPSIEDKADAMAETLWAGIQQTASEPNADSVSLLGLVKVLRASGINTPDAVGGSRGGRGGRGAGASGRGGGQSGGGHGAPNSPEEIRAKFDSMDRDRNGVWEGDEINAYMSGQPASSDNKVTFEEYSEAWAELRSRMGSGGGGHNHGGGGAGGNRGGNRGGQGAGGGGRGAGGRGAGGHGPGGHGPGGHSHGSGQGRGGGQGRGRGAATAPESNINTNAEFVVSLDANRDRKITRDELIPALIAALTPAPVEETDASDESQTSAAPANMDRQQRGLERRTQMLVKAIAVCSAWHAIDTNGDQKIQSTELNARLGTKEATGVAESFGITEDKALPLSELFPAARRLSDEQVDAALKR